MDDNKRQEFREKYAQLADEQLLEMLSYGRDAYEIGVFELIEGEVRNRGLEIRAEGSQEEAVDEPLPQLPAEPGFDVNTYVQIAVVDNAEDKDFLGKKLEASDIPFYFQALHIRDKALPVGLMVAAARVEDAIALLKDFKPQGSIILW